MSNCCLFKKELVARERLKQLHHNPLHERLPIKEKHEENV